MFGIHLFVQLCCFVVVFLMLCARPAPADAARARAASARRRRDVPLPRRAHRRPPRRVPRRALDPPDARTRRPGRAAPPRTRRRRYFFLTLFLGLYRIITLPVLAAGRKKFRKNNGMWDTSTQAGLRYTSISHVHKIVAAIYYFVNIRAAVRLGDSIYYAKDSWVTLFHQTGGSQRELRKLLQRRHNTMEDITTR